ncbi:hypothetical protein A2U01_0105761, partial [Trifolium medium]|nr:hypothetical protein [Trifolium medium]
MRRKVVLRARETTRRCVGRTWGRVRPAGCDGVWTIVVAGV